MKKCKKCSIEKPTSEFYVLIGNKDGLNGSCKNCVRARVRKRELRLRKDPVWYKNEKKRHREKYHRLNYLEKHKPTPERKKEIMERYAKRYPEKMLAHSAKGSAKPLIDGNELHHWSYNKEHWKDMIELTNMEHNKLHRYMIYDQERMMYRSLDGVLLDTREKHIEYFESIKNLD